MIAKTSSKLNLCNHIRSPRTLLLLSLVFQEGVHFNSIVWSWRWDLLSRLRMIASILLLPQNKCIILEPTVLYVLSARCTAWHRTIPLTLIFSQTNAMGLQQPGKSSLLYYQEETDSSQSPENMNLSSTYWDSTGGLASPSRPTFSPQYNHSERATRHPTLLIGQVSNSMIYYNRSNSDRLLVPRRSALTHSPRTRRRRSHSSEHGDSVKVCVTNGSTLPQSTCAQQLNDSMIYLDGPQVYTCSMCRTHLTSHDEIISKSFHGRHGKSATFI